MSTANHSASKYRNQAQKLEEKQSCKVRAHQTDKGRVGWDHQIHTSRLPRMIRNHMHTRLYQAPCQLCLTTSLLATDSISHEGPRFFTLVQPWRTSIFFLTEPPHFRFSLNGHTFCNKPLTNKEFFLEAFLFKKQTFGFKAPPFHEYLLYKKNFSPCCWWTHLDTVQLFPQLHTV